ERAMVPVEDKQPDLEAAHSKAVSFFDDLDDVEQCVQSLEPDDRRIEFKNAFKRFSQLMDIVLPDPMANPYREDLEQLSAIYGTAKERYRDETMNLEGAGAKVRELIQDHITSRGIEVLNDEPVSIMDEVEYDAKVEDLESDEARASEMQNAIKHEINVKFDEDPVQYGSLKDRLEELIEKYREGRYDERETIEELRALMDEIRSRDKQARKKGLRDETDLSFYHAVEDVLGDHEAGDEEAIELTGTLVETVEGFVTKVEWKERTHLQNQMRKAVTRDLYRSEIDLSADQRQVLTNRVIELARAHYQ
ncbi:type I restriction enzyme endonuclease domain-containing protein, partial [Halorubrum sp. Atlit-26R]|uniref:type I restriction enzyme endonuclease domain-containing protein n=1 Tax=Halorubrum sp. Atlit-26R TaxID=2282128 RepID=UPI000EF17C87